MCHASRRTVTTIRARGSTAGRPSTLPDTRLRLESITKSETARYSDNDDDELYLRALIS